MTAQTNLLSVPVARAESLAVMVPVLIIVAPIVAQEPLVDKRNTAVQPGGNAAIADVEPAAKS